jgi:enoyl-CoA hydratase/carnithine racemase
MAKAEFRVDDGLGEVVISDPPLNLFGMELLDDLATATEQAAASDVRAILVRAEGDAFSGARTWRYSSTATRKRRWS